MGVGIHLIHRKMAGIVHMCSDIDGNVRMGIPEFKLLMPLLLDNYKLVYQLDELKEQSFVAYLVNDTEWLRELANRIEKLETSLIQRYP